MNQEIPSRSKFWDKKSKAQRKKSRLVSFFQLCTASGAAIPATSLFPFLRCRCCLTERLVRIGHNIRLFGRSLVARPVLWQPAQLPDETRGYRGRLAQNSDPSNAWAVPWHLQSDFCLPVKVLFVSDSLGPAGERDMKGECRFEKPFASSWPSTWL